MKILFFLCLLVGAYKLYNYYPEYKHQKEMKSMVAKLPPGKTITMYALTTCGYCKQKESQFNALGVPYVEHFIDEDQPREAELWAKIRQAGLPMKEYGFPIFEINGELVLDNPPVESILAMGAATR